MKFFWQNLKSLRTKFRFPRVFFTSKCAALFVKCSFVRPAKSFYPLVRFFFSVFEKVKNRNSDSWSKIVASKLFRCVCRMHLWERYRNFLTKFRKGVIQVQLTCPRSRKKIFRNKIYPQAVTLCTYNVLLSNILIFYRKKSACGHESPKLFEKPLFSSGKKTSSSSFSVYVVGFVNNTFEKIFQKVWKSLAQIRLKVECKKICFTEFLLRKFV